MFGLAKQSARGLGAVVLAALASSIASPVACDRSPRSAARSDVKPRETVPDASMQAARHVARHRPRSTETVARAQRSMQANVLAAPYASATFADVVWKDDVVVIDGPALNAVLTTDPLRNRHVFDAGKLATHRIALRRGTVLLIAGSALGRIVSIEHDGSTLMVETGFAALSDAIAAGTLSWRADLPIGEQWITHLARTTSFRNVGGFRVEMDIGGQDLTAELCVSATDSGARLSVHATAGPLRSIGRIEFRGGRLARFEHELEVATSASLEVAATRVERRVFRFAPPEPLLRWIVLVGPVPVELTMSAEIATSLEAPPRTSGTAKSTVEIVGRAQLTYDGKSVSTAAILSRDRALNDDFESASLTGAPVNVQWGVAFPQVSVRLFHLPMVPRLHAATTVQAGIAVDPPCRIATTRSGIDLGWDLGVLGTELASDHRETWSRVQHAPSHTCDGS